MMKELVEELNQIIQFLHIMLIHFNILIRNRNTSLPWEIIKIKNEAFETTKPFIEQVEHLCKDIIRSTE